MIQGVDTFIEYFGGIRRRTLKFIRAIPNNQIDWSPNDSELTCGDIARHLAATEKMFVNAAVKGQWEYAGHDQDMANTLDEAIIHLEACHSVAMTTLRTLSDTELYQSRPTLNSRPVKAWRLLMAMVEHEVHHRSQ
ncbi:MAG: DinB family protein, partial [Chloroflexi bacterium]|nr:DinB family protein [Chloroflexota bacterium]